MDNNDNFPNIWYAILIIIIFLGIQLFFAAVMQAMGADPFSVNIHYELLFSVASYAVLFFALMRYMKTDIKQIFMPSKVLTQQLWTRTLLAVFLVSLGGFFLLDDLDKIVLHFYPISEEETALFETLLGGGFSAVIMVCVVAPLAEEMLFRGIFLRGFLRNYKPFNAILLSAFLFAVIHFNIYQAVGAYIMGTLLGWLYTVTRSLWPCVLTHALLNIFSMSAYYFYGSYEKALEVPFNSPVIMIIAALSSAAGLKIIHAVSEAIKR